MGASGPQCWFHSLLSSACCYPHSLLSVLHAKVRHGSLRPRRRHGMRGEKTVLLLIKACSVHHRMNRVSEWGKPGLNRLRNGPRLETLPSVLAKHAYNFIQLYVFCGTSEGNHLFIESTAPQTRRSGQNHSGAD